MLPSRRIDVLTVAGALVLFTAGCAPPPWTCPAVVPAAGSACQIPMLAGSSCTYMACSTYGVTTATCPGGTWQINTAPCAPAVCDQFSTPSMCPAGQVCVESQGGARVFQCRVPACTTDLVDCACICGGNCISGSGTGWTCNTCPGGGCP